MTTFFILKRLVSLYFWGENFETMFYLTIGQTDYLSKKRIITKMTHNKIDEHILRQLWISIIALIHTKNHQIFNMSNKSFYSDNYWRIKYILWNNSRRTDVTLSQIDCLWVFNLFSSKILILFFNYSGHPSATWIIILIPRCLVFGMSNIRQQKLFKIKRLIDPLDKRSLHILSDPSFKCFCYLLQ